MEGFQYSVMYRKGINNIADFLSRQNDHRAIAAVGTRNKGKKTRLDYAAWNKGKRAYKPVSDGNVTQTEDLTASTLLTPIIKPSGNKEQALGERGAQWVR